MSKVKKYIIIVFIFIVIFLIGNYLYQKYTYTLEKVSFMLNSAELPSNIHTEHKSYHGDSTEPIYYINTYKTDNLAYVLQENDSQKIEQFYDYNLLKHIIILHNEKKIFSYPCEADEGSAIPFRETFFIAVEQHGLYEHRGNYKFHGIETINGNKCIKVSLTDNYENEIDVNYFYIDLETNFIIKKESYSGKNKKELKRNYAETVEYNFNTVTDDQVLKFDINNYPDYEYIEY